MTSTDVGFRDLILAVSKLSADADGAREIMETLGIQFRAISPEPPGQGSVPKGGGLGDDLEIDPGKAKRMPTRRAAKHDPKVLPSTLTHVESSQDSDLGQRVQQADPLARDSDSGPKPPRFVPLLVHRWTRGILKASLSTMETGTEIDIDRWIDAVAACRPVSPLPLLKVPLLRRGVQVLIDRGESMSLFRRDQQWLIDQIEHTVGKEKVQLLSYRGCPTWGVRDVRLNQPIGYQPPVAGTPVLLLSGLSIERSGPLTASTSLESWHRFADDLRGQGSPVVALVPYRMAAWPASLRRRIVCIPWDCRTTATVVRGLVGRFGEVPA